MMAAHANAWKPSVLVNEDMDIQLRYLLVMLTNGPSQQLIRQQPSDMHAFRNLARRFNPRSQAHSLVQVQLLMHFDLGQEPVDDADCMIMVGRLVGVSETSSGVLLGVHVRCAVLMERVPLELRTHLLLTCDKQWEATH